MTSVDTSRRIPSFIMIGVASAAVAFGAPWALATPSLAPTIHGEGQDEVADLIAAGDAAMANSEYQMAMDKYNAALQIDPSNGDALFGKGRAETMLNQGGGIDDVADDLATRINQTRAEFDAAMANASHLLEQNQFAEAQTTMVTAQVRLDTARSLLSESEYRERTGRARAMSEQITDARSIFDQNQAAEAQIQIEQDQLEKQREADAKRNAQINSNLLRVRELQLQRNYAEALEVVSRILFLDEGNPAALALQDALQTAALWQGYLPTERDRELGLAVSFEENRQATIPPRRNFGAGPRSTTGIMVYPEDWPNISIRRTSDAGFIDSNANRRVAAAINDTLLPRVDFEGQRFAAVLDYFKSVADINVMPDWKALDLIGVTQDDPVHLQLTNVPVRTAMERVFEGLGEEFDKPEYAIQDGLLVVSSDDAIKQHVLTLVYDIKDLLFEVPYFDNAPPLDLDEALNGGRQAALASRSAFDASANRQARNDDPYSGRSARDGDGLFNGGGASSAPNRENKVASIVSMIENTVDPESWRDFGGNSGSISELSGNLIITQTPRAQRSIQGLLSQLREIRALQINIESRFLTVDMNWFEQIGFDLDLYFNTNSTLFSSARAADPLFQLGDFFDGGGRLKDPLIFSGINDVDGDGQPDPPGNTFNLGGAFGIPDATGLNIVYPVGPVGPPLRTTDGFTPTGITQDSFNLVNLLGGFAADSFAGTVLSGNPALSMGISFIDDIQVDLLIEATQADRRNVILTAPRLTLFNGQRSWVLVGTQTAIVSALIPIVGDASGAFQPITSTLTDGVVLDVEAVISADRRYVTMTIITGVRETVSIETLEFSGAAGGGIGGGGGGGGAAAQFAGSISLPEVEVALVNTSTSVPDKGTVLIGGQRLVREVEVETGVPVLSKIPFINRFFTNRVTSKDESTLLILVRPEIIIQLENEDLLFPGLSDTIGIGVGY